MEEIQDTQGALWEVFIQSKKSNILKRLKKRQNFNQKL